MKKESAVQFNREVENYRRALLEHARKRDWETFKAKAGKMFDYVESVEFRELERRFFRTFYLILGSLILALVAFFNVDFEVHQELMRMKTNILFSALVVCSFEFFFFINYRHHVDGKMVYRDRRREKFIRGIELDFRHYAEQIERRAA